MSLDSRTRETLANNAVHDACNISNSEPGSIVSAPEEQDNPEAGGTLDEAEKLDFLKSILPESGLYCYGR